MEKIIKVEKIPQRQIDDEDIFALVCYFYPQYTFKTAKAMPYKRIKQLIRVARQQEAYKYHNLTQIAAAPHTKKGEGVKKLMDYYNDIMRNG